MQQTQRALEHAQQVREMHPRVGALVNAQLLQLDIPVTELIPEETIEQVRALVETERLLRVIHLRGDVAQTVEDPGVFERDRAAGGKRLRRNSFDRVELELFDFQLLHLQIRH